MMMMMLMMEEEQLLPYEVQLMVDYYCCRWRMTFHGLLGPPLF
jgi:hypothetical protein